MTEEDRTRSQNRSGPTPCCHPRSQAANSEDGTPQSVGCLTEERNPLPTPEILKERIQRAADVLMRYAAKEVYVFGSAATGRMRANSDVDITVVGVPPSVWYKAWYEAAGELDRELDLVDLDQDDPVTVSIRKHGGLRRVR
ncbi:MAG: nucleotidyltransferase domain-containing protein [Acidobacteriota bacterium]